MAGGGRDSSSFYDRLITVFGEEDRVDGGNKGRELVNIIYGMGEVGVEWRSLPETVKVAFLNRIQLDLSQVDVHYETVNGIFTG